MSTEEAAHIFGTSPNLFLLAKRDDLNLLPTSSSVIFRPFQSPILLQLDPHWVSFSKYNLGRPRRGSLAQICYMDTWSAPNLVSATMYGRVRDCGVRQEEASLSLLGLDNTMVVFSL